MKDFEKLQILFKKLFQFDTSDLDFGIYRILNYKRTQTEKFISEDLKNKVIPMRVWKQTDVKYYA